MKQARTLFGPGMELAVDIQSQSQRFHINFIQHTHAESKTFSKTCLMEPESKARIQQAGFSCRQIQSRQSFFLSDPVRPVGGVEDADGVDDAWPSVLYAPTGP